MISRYFDSEGERQDFDEEIATARTSGIFRDHTITEQDLRDFPELREGNSWSPHVLATPVTDPVVAEYPRTDVKTLDHSSTGARMLHEELAGFRFALQDTSNLITPRRVSRPPRRLGFDN